MSNKKVPIPCTLSIIERVDDDLICRLYVAAYPRLKNPRYRSRVRYKTLGCSSCYDWGCCTGKIAERADRKILRLTERLNKKSIVLRFTGGISSFREIDNRY